MSCATADVDSLDVAFRDGVAVLALFRFRGGSVGRFDPSSVRPVEALGTGSEFFSTTVLALGCLVDESVDDGSVGEEVSAFVEADEVDESEADEVASDGAASATPGMVAAAVPTPSATANAPTRPMHLT